MSLPIQSILLHIDTDDTHLGMARQAALLASEYGSELHLLYLSPETPPLPEDTGWSAIKYAQLKTWKAELEILYDIRVIIHMDKGSQALKLEEYSDRLSADVVIMRKQEDNKAIYTELLLTRYLCLPSTLN